MMESAGLERWLNQAGIAVRGEWLQACVDWILNEEGPRVTQAQLRDLVYEQWLHGDLRNLAVERSGIPQDVLSQQKHQIDGKFIVQVESVIDVGAPACSQLQKLKGQSLDLTEPLEEKYECKSTRMLLMSLTDGMSEFQGMEYQPIPQLSVQGTPPGTKLQLEGRIDCRLGVLLLCPSHVKVLGGKVEELMERNHQKRVLERALNIEDSSDSGQHTGPTATNQQSSTVPDSSSVRPAPSNAVVIDLTESIDSTRQQNPQRTGISLGGDDNLEVDMDISEFDDFDCDDDYEQFVAVAPPVMGAEEGHVTDEQQFDNRDIDNPDEDFENKQLHVAHVKREFEQEMLQSSESRGLINQGGDNPKLSLTRPVTQTGTKAKGTLVATVKPFALKDEVDEDEMLEGSPNQRFNTFGSRQPLLHSLSDVRKPSVWQRHQVVTVKAYFIKVVEQLSYNTGVWMVTVQIGDIEGTHLNVHINNEILEQLLGFTAEEFAQDMEPYQSNPKVRSKASQGFKRCQTALADLNCFMELQKRSTHKLPFIEKLQDCNH